MTVPELNPNGESGVNGSGAADDKRQPVIGMIASLHMIGMIASLHEI